MEVQRRSFLTLELDESEWLASRPGRFTYGIHRTDGWVGPRAGLDVWEKRKTSYPCVEILLFGSCKKRGIRGRIQ